MSGGKRKGQPRWSTAEDFMKKMQGDPELMSKQRQRAEERKATLQRNQVAERELVQELREAGYPICSVQDLVQLGRSYSDVVPLLASWLHRVSEAEVKEAIVRALSVPWASQAADALIREFEIGGEELRWAIGNALQVISEPGMENDLLRLASDRMYGAGRQMVVLALGKIDTPRVKTVLIELLEDEDVKGHAVVALGHLKAGEAQQRLEALTKDERAWIRAEARKALDRMRAE